MADRVIWERNVDQDKIRARYERFRMRFFPAAGVILLLILAVGGWKNAIGVALVLGLVGLAWHTTVRYQALNDAANPVITVGQGRVKLGNRSVIIEDVKRFTTIATTMQTSLLGRHSQIQLGKAIFRMDVPGTKREPILIEFGWPNMTAEGVAEIKAALEPELPGKWVEPLDLVEKEELPKKLRRPRLTNRDGRPGLL